MSSPDSGRGGGFHPCPQMTTLGYTNPRAQRLAIAPLTHHEDSTPPTPNIFRRHRSRRAYSFDEIQTIISPEERSIDDFVGVPTDDAQIKKQPRKTRPYYENLSLIQEHYAEVDQLLSGDLPHLIAESFFHPPEQRSYANLDEATGQRWNLHSLRGPEIPAQRDVEAAETTPLLGTIGQKESQRERTARLAININTIVNILLVAAKAVAVWYSSSISLTASLVDSALDLLSTFIILGTSWAIGAPSDRHKYPAGKRRFEPLGVLIFSVVMIVSFVQVFIESLQRTIKAYHGKGEAIDLSWIGIGTMLATIAVKSVLWAWCSQIPSSGVQALAQDAENDVWLNVMSLSFPYIGTRVGSHMLDPIGGLCLSTYIIYQWIKTLFQNFANLSGKSASGDQYTRVLYLVGRFNPVLEISAVECYHIGDDLVVEVDVILPNTSLHFAHDVGETIQVMLENLDGVVRAYVHTDYSSSNPSQHTDRSKGAAGGPAPLALPPAVNSDESSTNLASSATPKAVSTMPRRVNETPKGIQSSKAVTNGSHR